MIYSDNTYDITNDISTYLRRDFKSVYDTSREKWYMLNNIDAYEEYGIYGTDFSTQYLGKLVEVNGHEYEWDGTEWVDLGTAISVPYIQFPENDSWSSGAYFETALYLKNTYTIEMQFKTPESNGSAWRQMIGAYDNNQLDTGNAFAIYTANNNNYFGVNYWRYGSSRQGIDNAWPYATNTLYNLTINVGTGDAVLNGVSYSGSGNNVTGTLSRVLQIGGVQMQWGDPGFNGRIYYVKVTEGNTLVANFQADNTDGPKFKDLVSGTSFSKGGNGIVTYGEDGGGRPKDYDEKTAPIITNVWPSRLYRNNKHLYKLLRNEEEVLIERYMDKDIYKKGKVNTPTPPTSNAYIHIDWTSYNNGYHPYIDLGYVPTSTTNVEMTYRLASSSFNVGDTRIFGMNGDSALYSPNGGFAARIRTGSSPNYYFEPTYGSHSLDQAASITPLQDFTVRFDQTTNSGYFTFYMNGNNILQWNVSSLLTLPLYVFMSNNNYGNFTSDAPHPDEWLKEFKIYEGDTLVCNFIPYIQNNVVGLYDTISGQFKAPTNGDMAYETLA